MTKQELKNYVVLDKEVNHLEERIQRLENSLISPKIQLISDMPKGGGLEDTGDKIAKLMDLKALYNERWDKLISERLRIEKAINGLKEPIERLLMSLKYIDGMTWEEVCVKINYSWRQVHYLHKRALKNIA